MFWQPMKFGYGIVGWGAALAGQGTCQLLRGGCRGWSAGRGLRLFGLFHMFLRHFGGARGGRGSGGRLSGECQASGCQSQGEAENGREDLFHIFVRFSFSRFFYFRLCND